MALSDLHKERIRTLANYLRGNVTPEHFDMGAWWSNHREGGLPYWQYDLRALAADDASDKQVAEAVIKDCGTAACVGGWASLLWPDEIGLNERTISARAGAFLGLSPAAAEALFTPAGFDWDNHKRRFTLKRAIETLERLADTGKVQWFKTDEPVEA